MPSGFAAASSLTDKAAFLENWESRLFIPAYVGRIMQSVQKGLRAGEIAKDTYDRLECAECGIQLTTKNDPDDVGSVRTCPECGREWRQLK